MVKFVVKERGEGEACFVTDEYHGLIFEMKPPATTRRQRHSPLT